MAFPSLPLSTSPDRSRAAFVASNATLIGQVTLGDGCSIWYGAVLRGDVEAIRVGAHSNVQDGPFCTATLVSRRSWRTM